MTAACTSTSEPRPSPDLMAVVAVLDGDSMVVESEGREAEVRLLGINAPERGECFSDEAAGSLRRLVADNRVRLAGSDEDRFGRLLRYVYTEDGVLVNEQLVSTGAAIALSNDHELAAEFKSAEGVAFEERLGRFGSGVCGQAFERDSAITISDVEPDAPGNDAENPNGEWIEIANTGAVPIPLEGWSIQDESSTHRFGFPDDFVLGPEDRVRVFSGCGDNGLTALFWCGDDPVWTNRGDTAYLLDAAGNVLDRRPV